MFCENCGSEVSKNAKFCGSCGARIENNHTVKQTPKPKVHDTYKKENTSDNTSIIVTAILAGIGTTVLTTVLIFLFNKWTEFQFHTFMLWVIIPVGGAIVGALSSLGFFLVLHNKKVKPTKALYFTASVLAVISFMGINYAEYTDTYYEGEHISNYEYEGVQLTYFNYLNYDLNTPKEHTLSYRGRTSSGVTYESSTVQNKWIFFSNLALAALGAFITGGIIFEEKDNRHLKHHTYV